MFLALLCLVMISGLDARTNPRLGLDQGGAVRAAREALRESGRYPWYDADRDRIKRVSLPPRPEPPEIAEWEPKPGRPQSDWSGLWQGGDLLGWSIVGLIFLFLVVVLVRTIWRGETAVDGGASDSTTPRGTWHDADHVGRLPFPLQRPQTDLLSEVRRCYEAGRYGEAVIFLFSYQLIRLDHNHLIRLAKGKTNRQYLREIGEQRNLAPIVRATMIAYEDVFFGRHALERHRFEACWHRLDEFHRGVHQAAGTR